MLLGTAALPGAARAHEPLGPLSPPRPAPPLPLVLHDGRNTPLPALLQGRITAVQLMFTGCSATCPVQGALFGELQRLVTSAEPLPAAQLLSLSIDPLSDDAAALAAWRRRFGAGHHWWAAAPPVRHAQAMEEFVVGKPGKATAAANGDRHPTQVYLFDKLGRLAFRTAEWASPGSIAAAMRQLAARSG